VRPVPPADDVHDRRHQHEPDQERVQRHRGGQADADLLEQALTAEQK
jgi:hypothetical protein